MTEAAVILGLDEDLAWHYLVAANNLCDQPLIRTRADQPVPTVHARRLLSRDEDLAQAFERFLDSPGGGAFRQFQQRHQFLRRLEARTSARNQFYCQVQSVRRERVNAVVTLNLGGGDRLAAHITARSAEELGLVAGRACHALIDPSWVEVRAECPAERNANRLCGRVARVLDDPVDAEVAIELAGGRILLATMTRAEMLDKDIRPGRAVGALIQSSQIILAVDQPAAATESRGEHP
ncbi:TOBE domain-containing protein [Parasulfuritortus cantonensis]|uniref:TOBE domain-containing protein n=1 Tax=Parasulfuritortus cantonensis TaxID=2528202 RepID=UPI0014046757|nr:TOBE domain-containing protein [Parasulfuritortus cantonensis]